MPRRRATDLDVSPEEQKQKSAQAEAKLEKALDITGRPPKCTPETVLLIQKLIVQGVKPKHAAAAAGVAARTFYTWQTKGTRSEENPKPMRRYARFVRALERAHSLCIQNLVAKVQRDANVDGKTALALLERLADDYSTTSRQKHEHSGPDGGPIKVEGTVSLEDLDRARQTALENEKPPTGAAGE